MRLFLRGYRYSHRNLMKLLKERKNNMLTKLVNTILDIARLSKNWWGDTILTCHVLNRVPAKNKETTPFNG